jgi:carbon starvation protein
MAFTLLLFTAIVLALGYRFYASRAAQDILYPDPKRPTPSRRYKDGKDFMPAPGGVLFGYQFKAITLDPILSPIIAVQFGWLPAVLWLLIGVLIAGWVQDYTASIMSMRNAGTGLGKLAGSYISPLARNLLLSFLYVYLLVIMGGFGVIFAPLMARETVAVSSLLLIGTGVLAGQMIYRWRLKVPVTTLVITLLSSLGIFAGTLPWVQNGVRAINSLAGVLFTRPLGYGDFSWPTLFWGLVLLAIAYLGAVLPIWRFAQPVNYTASWFFFLSLAGAVAGILAATFTRSVNTSFEIPAVVTAFQPHLGPIWPVLFVTISGGAISGWHALVATFSTARQVEKEPEALPIAAGAAFMETILAILAIIFAATLGVAAGRYNPDRNFQLVAGPASVFADGMARFLNVLGLPEALGAEIGVVLLALMALTVMQLVLRFMRQVSAELLGEALPVFKNVHFGALIGLLLSLFLIVFGFWQWLWVLFGGANQIIAGIALLLASIWLAQQKKPYGWTFWPGLFIFTTGMAALLYAVLYTAIYRGMVLSEGQEFGFTLGNGITAVLGLYLLGAALILFLQGLLALNKARFPQKNSP